jgi:phage-related protein
LACLGARDPAATSGNGGLMRRLRAAGNVVVENRGNGAPCPPKHVDELFQFWHTSIMKEVRWHGSSRSDVEAFPADARREAGYQLFQVQIGEEPSDWKPMTSIGPGVREIRIRQASGAYRVIYLATIGDAVHVLHAFQKKTQATAKRDIDLAKARLRQIR